MLEQRTKHHQRSQAGTPQVAARQMLCLPKPWLLAPHCARQTTLVNPSSSTAPAMLSTTTLASPLPHSPHTSPQFRAVLHALPGVVGSGFTPPCSGLVLPTLQAPLCFSPARLGSRRLQQGPPRHQALWSRSHCCSPHCFLLRSESPGKAHASAAKAYLILLLT